MVANDLQQRPSARDRRRDLALSIATQGGHVRGPEGGAHRSSTDRAEPAQGRHDPNFRLSMVVIATMCTRYCGYVREDPEYRLSMAAAATMDNR